MILKGTVVVFLLAALFLFRRQQENWNVFDPLTYEQVIAGRPQLLRPPYNRPYKKHNGTNFPGGDLQKQYVNNRKECEVLCTYSNVYDESFAKCVAYAVATKGDPAQQGKRMCYLKRREVVNSTQATKDPNWDSGVHPGYSYW